MDFFMKRNILCLLTLWLNKSRVECAEHTNYFLASLRYCVKYFFLKFRILKFKFIICFNLRKSVSIYISIGIVEYKPPPRRPLSAKDLHPFYKTNPIPPSSPYPSKFQTSSPCWPILYRRMLVGG